MSGSVMVRTFKPLEGDHTCSLDTEGRYRGIPKLSDLPDRRTTLFAGIWRAQYQASWGDHLLHDFIVTQWLRNYSVRLVAHTRKSYLGLRVQAAIRRPKPQLIRPPFCLTKNARTLRDPATAAIFLRRTSL